ncbi:MAG TPA: class I SAM-dependent methyltransferase [Thermoanaerobaculia bacterium]|nr:class I SAM-dependent methyltransferase [Thermoanaerobaculia bacterium]
MSSWYGEDLAWIHHAGHSDFAESIAPWLISVLPRGLIVDIGCGSGVLARELTNAGFEVLGIDASPSMIALARDTAPRARFEVGSLTTASIPPCAAIVATGEVLNYGDLRSFVKRVRTNLLIFDIAERGSYPAHSEHRAGGDDWSVIAIKDSDGVRLTRHVLTFRKIGGEIRRAEEVHELELYDANEVKTLLREAGFAVRTRRSYGSYRLPNGHKVYISRWREG